jgi:hypothetical protein
MGFLNQIMLLGLLAVGVPILVHLLNRYRYREIDWGAMELLRKAMVVRSRRIRIEDLILLILRCLAVALLAMAMARPTVGAAGARFFGGESRVGMTIALDASYSMAHRPGVHSRFDAAIEKVHEVLKTLQPGDQVSVVLMGQRPRAVLRNVSYDENRIEEKLKELAVLPERLNLELCLEQVADLVAEVRAPVKECYLISDSQDLSWRQLSDRSKKTVAELSRAGKVYYLAAPAGSYENLAITDLQLSGGAMRAGSMVRYVAGVRNFGKNPAKNVAVTLKMDRRTPDRRVVDTIAPGQTVAVPLYGKFETAGNVQVSAMLERDALPMDDVRYAAARVRDQIRVLVVDGDPGRGANEGSSYYIMKALVPDPTKPSQATMRIKRIPYVEFALHRPGDYDVVILANVADIRTEQAQALHSFVRQGGGLMIFLGEKVNPRIMEARMQVGTDSLLPGKIADKPLESTGEGATGWSVEQAEANHVLGNFIKMLPKPLMDEARVRKLMSVTPTAGAHAILKAAGTTGGDAPLLLEKRIGRGEILLFTSSADRTWGNLAIHPAFLMMLHESVTYLTRRGFERDFTVGEPLVIPVGSQAVADQFLLVAPNGQITPIQATETKSEQGEQSERSARCDPPETAGFYELRIDDKTTPLMVAANVDSTESDVRTLSTEELHTSLAGQPINVLEGADLLAEIKQGRSGLELWRIFMFTGLLVLLAEGFLAWYFSRKLGAEESALPKSARETILGSKEAA